MPVASSVATSTALRAAIRSLAGQATKIKCLTEAASQRKKQPAMPGRSRNPPKEKSRKPTAAAGPPGEGTDTRRLAVSRGKALT